MTVSEPAAVRDQQYRPVLLTADASSVQPGGVVDVTAPSTTTSEEAAGGRGEVGAGGDGARRGVDGVGGVAGDAGGGDGDVVDPFGGGDGGRFDVGRGDDAEGGHGGPVSVESRRPETVRAPWLTWRAIVLTSRARSLMTAAGLALISELVTP